MLSPRPTKWGLSWVAHGSSVWAFFLLGLDQDLCIPQRSGWRAESSQRCLDLRWWFLKLHFLASVCQIHQVEDASLCWWEKWWECWLRLSFRCHYTWIVGVINPIFSPLYLNNLYVGFPWKLWEYQVNFSSLPYCYGKLDSFVQDESFLGARGLGFVWFAFAYIQN